MPPGVYKCTSCYAHETKTHKLFRNKFFLHLSKKYHFYRDKKCGTLISVLVKKLENVKILLIFGILIKRLSKSTVYTGHNRFKSYLRYSNFYKPDTAK
jgi:hypothetical protein